MKDYDPTERDHSILGHSPRIEPDDDDVLDPRAAAAIEQLRVMHKYPPQVRVHPFFLTLARTPQACASYLQLGADLSADTALDPGLRELAVLRTGWLCGAPYQWGEHKRVARKLGIGEDAIARVQEGSAAPGWSRCEAAVLRAVEELHADAMIGDDTWAELASCLDERQLVELPLLVGHYHMTAFVQNALRIPLNAGNAGLSGVDEASEALL